MRVIFLSLRNVRANPFRSLALGLFVFAASVIFVLFNSFQDTVTGNLEAALLDALTGDLQIRPSESDETDMLSLNKTWNELPTLDGEQVDSATRALEPGAAVVRRLRQAVLISNEEEQQPALLIGIEPEASAYHRPLRLSEGRYLEPGEENEIILSRQQAEELGVAVGDTVDLLYARDGELPSVVTVKVVGIGELDLFNMFGMFFNYTTLGAVQELLDYEDGEITDLIAYVPEGEDLEALTSALQERLASDGVSVTNRRSMGGFIMGGIQIYAALFYGFIGVLLVIVGLLIMNLVYMIGIERRREIGTLRAIGFSRWAIVAMFVGEITIISFIFNLIGVAAGTGIVLALGEVGLYPSPPLDFVMGKEFFIRFAPEHALLPVVVISLYSLVASLFPSYQAASLRPVELMAEN